MLSHTGMGFLGLFTGRLEEAGGPAVIEVNLWWEAWGSN